MGIQAIGKFDGERSDKMEVRKGGEELFGMTLAYDARAGGEIYSSSGSLARQWSVFPPLVGQ